MAFESENRVTNTGAEPWTREKGLLSIWILGMFPPSDGATVVIPFVPGSVEELGPVVNDAYFGKVPSDRLIVDSERLYFRADGRYRSKIGIPPRRATTVCGSYDPERGVLTLVQLTIPMGARDYVNSMWQLQDEPFAGDVVNSYNDGPPEPGAKPLGPFYELESSSPALELAPGEFQEHVHRTAHLLGSDEPWTPSPGPLWVWRSPRSGGSSRPRVGEPGTSRWIDQRGPQISLVDPAVQPCNQA